MPWYLVPYVTVAGPRPRQYCGLQDYDALIKADGGNWTEAEINNGLAVAKVSASAATLATLDAAPGFYRIPVDNLLDRLSGLSTQQLNALNNRLLALGFTQAEIDAALGNIRGYDLDALLRFVTSRRRKKRWNGSQFVFDGPVQPCRSAASVNAEVP